MSELNVQNTNLEVLESFDPSITVINCSGNRLVTLPELPPGLLVLNCSHNSLNELPTLPVSIQSVDCAFTNIRVLTLPPTLLNLTNIRCDWCDLVAIPVLPPNVREFSCSNNPMDALSAPLPQGLLTLICCSCHLEGLPELPISLLHLKCEHNVISELPELPPGLKHLLCLDNMLERLPELPGSLLELKCDHNEIRELPALPDGIVTVNCSFNHIRELPAIPDSLEDFDFTRNPLSQASFDMLTDTFPFYPFNRADYPNDFLVQDVPEAVAEADEHEEPEEPELTEGDLIEARNIAVQYEVHDAFDKIDIAKLIPIIDSDTPPYDAERLFDSIRQLVYGNTLDTEEKGRIISLFEQVSHNIRDALELCMRDAHTQRLISAVLAYIGRQNPEFKNNYIRFLIDDISSAYEFNPEIPDMETASCPKGIKERIIMNLKNATLGQTDEYKPLINAFEKIPIDIMREFTSACLADPRVQELFDKDPPTSDEKARIVADCIREKLRAASYFSAPRGAEEVPDPPEFLEYISTLKYGFEGGTRRKKIKKKKTRKLKSKKTKRKIKKLKYSKKKKIK
jgi:Leucine-rich repeat (LRR) protein